MEKKFNWSTLVLGIIIGAVVVGVIWFAIPKQSKAGSVGNINDRCMLENLATCIRTAMSAGRDLNGFDPAAAAQDCVSKAKLICDVGGGNDGGGIDPLPLQ